MSTSDPKCVLCSEVGHIGKDCMANICILCLEEGHRYLECETREVVRAVETKEPHGAYQEDIYQMMVEQYEINRFLSTKEINQLLE